MSESKSATCKCVPYGRPCAECKQRFMAGVSLVGEIVLSPWAGSKYFKVHVPVDQMPIGPLYSVSQPSRVGVSVPEGWVLVPLEPTEQMLAAPWAGQLVSASIEAAEEREKQALRFYRVMLNAAPPAPKGDAA